MWFQESSTTYGTMNGFLSHKISPKTLIGCWGMKERKSKYSFEVRNPKSIMSGHGVRGSERPWMREARKTGII